MRGERGERVKKLLFWERSERAFAYREERRTTKLQCSNTHRLAEYY